MSDRDASTVRIGLAGLGIHGARYAKHLLAGEVAGARLAAVTRGDRERGAAFAREHGLAWAESVEELAAHAHVDALVLALPPSLHPPAVLAGLRAGRPVLVEKPLAATAVAARQLEHDAGPDARVMVAQTLRFDATIRALADARPRLGELHLVAIDQRFEPTGRPWLDDPREGGLLSNTGIHGVDLMRHLTGSELADARGMARRVVLERTEDLFAAVVRLEPGSILATIDNSRATEARTGRVALVGRHGQLLADHVHRTLVHVRGRRAEPLPVPQPVHTVRAALEAFVEAVRDGRPMPIPLSEGRAAVEGVDLIRNAITEKSR